MGNTFYTRRILEPDLERYLDAGWEECGRTNCPSVACDQVLIWWPHGGQPVDPGKTKDRWSYTPFNAIREMVRAFTFGASKHPPLGWQTRDPEEYFDAAMRHVAEWRTGTRADHESSLHPLAHALADLAVVLWHELKGDK